MSTPAPTPLPQVVCFRCANHSLTGLSPNEAQEICHCAALDEFRAVTAVRRCRLFSPQPPKPEPPA